MRSLIYARIRVMSGSMIYAKYAIIILANLAREGAVIGFTKHRGKATQG